MPSQKWGGNPRWADGANRVEPATPNQVFDDTFQTQRRCTSKPKQPRAVKSVGPLEPVKSLNLVRLLRRPITVYPLAHRLPYTSPAKMVKRKCEFTSEESSAPVCYTPCPTNPILDTDGRICSLLSSSSLFRSLGLKWTSTSPCRTRHQISVPP